MDGNIKFYVFYDQISQLANAIVPQKKLSKGELKLSTKAYIKKAKIKYRDKPYSQIVKRDPADSKLMLLCKKFRNSVVNKARN